MAAVLKERPRMNDDSKEAHLALEAWARWARSAFLGLGWSPDSVLSRVIELGIRGASQSGPRLTEIDGLCEVVDRAIQRLDETQREVIMRTYLADDAAQVTARKCGLTYGYYREVLSYARRRVGDYISGAKTSVVFPTKEVVG